MKFGLRPCALQETSSAQDNVSKGEYCIQQTLVYHKILLLSITKINGVVDELLEVHGMAPGKRQKGLID